MSSIDFFKTCKTNVRVAEGLLETRYALYKPRHPESAREVVVSAVTNLRRSHVLCADSREAGLWVFEVPETANGETTENLELDYDLRIGEAGVLRDVTIQESGRWAGLRDLFLDAVAGALPFLLGEEHAVLPIRDTQYLVGPTSDEPYLVSDCRALVQLRPKLTESGALHISTNIRPSEYVTAQTLSKEGKMKAILAPYGSEACVVPSTENTKMDSSKRRVFSGPVWEAAVIEFLLTCNIFVEENEQWLLVVTDEHGEQTEQHLTWPARLCLFSTRTSDINHTSRKDWSYWFNSLSGSHGFFEDPIRAAEEWFVGAADRAVASSATPVFDAPTADTLTGPSTFVAETPMATSPPFNQRLMDQQAAAMGIYPTPPDGFAPNQHQHNPTSDGPSTAMAMDADNIVNDAELPGSEEAEGRGNSMESVRESQGYEPHSDDLFGEMAVEMDFGVNEIGDADFDYFDEPDELGERQSNGQDIVMEDNTADDEQSIESIHNANHFRPDGLEDELVDRSADHKYSFLNNTSLGHESSRPAEVEQLPGTDLSNDTGAHQDPEPPILEKALSPFGIRERLLPPPIPASAINNESRNLSMKRSSRTFDAVEFNENVDVSKRYVDVSTASQNVPNMKPDISLPSKSKKIRPDLESDIESGWSDDDESSDEDLYHIAGNIDGGAKDLPPKVPWESKKRKRTTQSTIEQYFAEQTTDPRFHGQDLDVITDEEIAAVLNGLRLANASHPLPHLHERQLTGSSHQRSKPMFTASLQELFELTGLHVNFVARMVSEQAVSTTRLHRQRYEHTENSFDGARNTVSTSLHALVGENLQRVLPQLDDCIPASLAGTRETASRPMPPQTKAPQAGQPRMPPREGSMHVGPDYFPLQAPFISIQRGPENWEMLPTAATFWTALGLGPASGPKDVAAVFIAPGNEDLLTLLEPFIYDLSNSYESSKLGHFRTDADWRDDIELPEDSNLRHEKGILAVDGTGDTSTFESVIAAYASACDTLGTALGQVGLEGSDHTIVVCLLDPFEDPSALKYLCACFWKLFDAYRQATSSHPQDQPRSDLVLQILPVSTVAAPESLVMLDAEEMSALAMEIYDRCPPSPQRIAATDIGYALPIIAAPAIELGPISGRRIGFHLVAEPSSDMMREGSIIHLAYALSADRQWMIICWIDPTGRYQVTATTCLRGKSFHEVATEVWDRTIEIISARDVMWRVFIVADMAIDRSIQQCWKDVAAAKSVKQVVHVTLLSIDDDPSICLSSPTQSESTLATAANAGSGFLTPPVTTPSASGATVSPDPSGLASNAPPTPTPTENTAAAESDPDAYLLDVTDESWGMLLSPAIMCDASPADMNPLLTGMIFRRGESSTGNTNVPLDALGVNLHWDIRARPGGVDEGGPPKQSEANFRDVLRMYRQLALLGRLRKVSGVEEGEQMVPVHMLHVRRGAEALDGYLG